MVNFKPWATAEPGTRVRVNQPGNMARMNGQTGIVLRMADEKGRYKRALLTMDGTHEPVVSWMSNLERIESMAYVSNLVGPKPEPVKEPEHPTPWRSEGRRIIDANGRVVLIVRQTAEDPRGMPHDIKMSTAYELARVVAEAVSAKYAPAQVEDSKSPF